MAPSASDAQWLKANQADLMADLGQVKQRLARHTGSHRHIDVPARPDKKAFGDRPPALLRLADAFSLSAFERDILLLCAGMELDAEVAGLCAEAQDGQAQPTFAMALATFPEAHWSALAPESALRRWRLVELGQGSVMTRAPLHIDERVLHYLTGLTELDPRLAALLEPLDPVDPQTLPASQAETARRMADAWSQAGRGRELTVAQLCGSALDCRPIAAAAASWLGLNAATLPAERLPTSAADLDMLLRLWDREVVMSNLGVLMIECDDALPVDSDAGRAVAMSVTRLLERVTGPLVLREREPRRITSRPSMALDVGHPDAAEQLAAWREALGRAAPPDADLAAATAQFNLSLPAIRAIAVEARATASPPEEVGTVVWDLCRRRLRSALDGLAQRIESDLHWDDLVLPAPQKAVLTSIAAQLRQRTTVHDAWGFAKKSRRGLGISALFYGPSGTGKTLAAEVLANELRLDLYHIDLSRVVSKYIGETESNLRKVFDAAEENGAILLFDEADSLFGARNEAKDAIDRYANVEVSYLLQRMEAYRGLAILTTNLRGSMDTAFLRRIRFALQFPFPGVAERAAIWSKVFPTDAPTAGLDPARLALLQLAGGNIRNVAINAAFLAADAGQPVGMGHVREAARGEYAKLERRLTEAENQAWA